MLTSGSGPQTLGVVDDTSATTGGVDIISVTGAALSGGGGASPP